MLQANPMNRHAALAGDYGINRGIDRRHGRYEYRVIVFGTGGGNAFDTLVVVRSGRKLSGQEIIDEAERRFAANEDLHRNYARDIRGLGPTPRTRSEIMSAAYNP